MAQKMKRWLRENFVFRFLLGHLLTLLVAMAVCTFSLNRAYDIVKADIQEAAAFSLSQSVESIDQRLASITTHGLQAIRDSHLPELSVMDYADGSDFYLAAKEVIRQYSQTSLYLPNLLSKQSFCYLSGSERFIYMSSIYNLDTFVFSMNTWGLTEAEIWQMIDDKVQAPHFYVALNGDLYLQFNITKQNSSSEKSGMVVYRISSADMMKYLSFSNNYEGYCLAIYDKTDALLWSRAAADSEETLPASWQEALLMQNDKYLVCRADGEGYTGLHYLLLLPQQQAMRKLLDLKLKVNLLILTGWLLSLAFSLFLSMKHGRPINKIFRTLSSSGEPVAVDLDCLSSAVGQVFQENQQLLHQQEASLPALQDEFFHNLLKSGFVSLDEMGDAARQANVQLTGNSYCAALLRIFPQIDADSIDGQTAADAKVLHALIAGQINEKCRRPVWSYKRNTLSVLYIFEIRNQQALLQIMQETTAWLKEKYHVLSRWGVSRPCDDLLQFWRSAEEAGEALNSINDFTEVALYDYTYPATDAYYLPYTVEDRFVQNMRTGNTKELQAVLNLLKLENCERRQLSRNQFLRLSQRIMDILLEQAYSLAEDDLQLMELSRIAFDSADDRQLYFAELESVSMEFCRKADSQRSTRRSEKVAAVEQYLRKNYRDSNLSLAKASTVFNLSEGYLSSIFKKETGINFADYLEQLRVNAACVLLEDGMKVTLVSEHVGYNSIQSFRRAFKRVKGSSPSEYKR